MIVDRSLWMWGIFVAIVIVLLALDLGLFHRKQHTIGIKESLAFSLFYFVISLLFGVFVWYQLGAQTGKEFFTGYLIEKSLSMDNIFVISLIFSYFAIPTKYQHRVLFYGILGVIILRGILIGLGAALVNDFEWVLYLFAAFLLFTGVKMLINVEKDMSLEENWLIKTLKHRVRVTDELHGKLFFVKLLHPKTGKMTRYATPLLLALVVVELVDIIFAIDSVPAIFSITTDPYVVYTSNIFAILGLRALYFALSAIIYRFKYLKYALALILIFISSKVFICGIFSIEKFPANISLGVTLALLAGGILFSLYKTREASSK